MSEFTPGADDLAEARFVSKEFLQFPFQKSETAVKQHTEQIWQIATRVT